MEHAVELAGRGVACDREFVGQGVPIERGTDGCCAWGEEVCVVGQTLLERRRNIPLAPHVVADDGWAVIMPTDAECGTTVPKVRRVWRVGLVGLHDVLCARHSRYLQIVMLLNEVEPEVAGVARAGMQQAGVGGFGEIHREVGCAALPAGSG